MENHQKENSWVRQGGGRLIERVSWKKFASTVGAMRKSREEGGFCKLGGWIINRDGIDTQKFVTEGSFDYRVT